MGPRTGSDFDDLANDYRPEPADDLSELKDRMRAVSGKRASKNAGTRSPDTSIAKVERGRSRQNSREKGSRFELRVAKQWSTWSGEHIRRTPQSGGWSNAKFGVSGDLVCDAKRWPFHIEAKAREGWHLDDLITGVRCEDTRSIKAWWIQTLTSCPEDKTPVMVFKRNNRQTLMMLQAIDWQRIMLRQPYIRVPTIEVDVDDSTVIVVSQDLFHEHVNYDRNLRFGLKRRRA